MADDHVAGLSSTWTKKEFIISLDLINRQPSSHFAALGANTHDLILLTERAQQALQI